MNPYRSMLNYNRLVAQSMCETWLQCYMGGKESCAAYVLANMLIRLHWHSVKAGIDISHRDRKLGALFGRIIRGHLDRVERPCSR